MPQLSIIVPVYNAERYLDQCIQSLLGQTCRDIEIILIDDGSTDGSGKICDRYQSENAQIKVIHQQNSGVSAARNAGMDAALGQWLCFVDSDDWVEPNMAEILLTYAEKEDADIHLFGYRKEYVDYSVARTLPETVLSASAKRNYVYQHEINLVSHSAVWAKLYRKNFITEHALRFSAELKIGEDELFLLYAMYSANQVRLHGECIYHYRTVISGAVSSNKVSEKHVQNAVLFQKGYAKFVDAYFTGEENSFMKQSEAIHSLLVLARSYQAAGFSRKEMLARIRGHLKEEPLRSAVKSLPLTLVPKRRRWQVWLLRMGLTALWVDVFRTADRLWAMKTAGQGHEMYP